MSEDNTPKDNKKPASEESYYFGGATIIEVEPTPVFSQDYGGYLIAST